MNKVFFGDCRDSMRKFIAAGVKVQTCVTSPPYFGLRDYGTATWEGGNPACDHAKGTAASKTSTLKNDGRPNPGSNNYEKSVIVPYRDICGKCGAIRVDQQLGLEETPQEYVNNMVEVFRLVRELLVDDGTCWINLGDSYSSGVPNLPDLIKRELESRILFYGSADPRRGSSERINVLIYDKRSPDLIFKPLFTSKRVSIKQWNNDLCEIGGAFDTPIQCFSSCAFSFAGPDRTDTEFFVNIPEYVGIVVAAGDLHTDAALRGAVALSIKDRKAPLPIEISAEPISESVSCGVPAFDSVTFNAASKSTSEVNSINETVPFLNRIKSPSCHYGDFIVREASREKVAFGLLSGIDLCFFGVSHLFSFNVGLVPYYTILDKAKRTWNCQRSKQELGVPEMLKRALMEDGWICRQTIIWHKPNPMPESVTDRCTKSHEYIFLLSKSERYYFDHEAIREDAKWERWGDQTVGKEQQGTAKWIGNKSKVDLQAIGKKNKRSVWEVATQPYSGAHFATFPPALIEPCILAGSRSGDIVLDPFLGSGTTAQVAQSLGRQWIGCELNRAYEPLHKKRTEQLGLVLA